MCIYIYERVNGISHTYAYNITNIYREFGQNIYLKISGECFRYEIVSLHNLVQHFVRFYSRFDVAFKDLKEITTDERFRYCQLRVNSIPADLAKRPTKHP